MGLRRDVCMRQRLFVLQLPLTIFILLILASSIVSYVIIYSALTSHASPFRGDYLQLRNKYLETDFPKVFYAAEWETVDASSGNIYTLSFSPIDLHAIMNFIVYDEKATQTFINENHLSDAFSVCVFEAKMMYDRFLGNNVNASLFFVENGTMKISNLEANYTRITVKDGLKAGDGTLSNITGLFVSGINQQKLFEVIFYGQEKDWNQISLQEVFRNILNSTKI